MRVMQGLAQVDGFDDLLALSRRLPIHINSSAMLNLYAGSETPFYTCRVLLPWTYEPDIRLQFKSMVNFIYPEAMVVPLDTRGYRITLVPETDETDAAIMLLPLLAGQRAEEQSQPLTRQYLWLLSLLKVVEEGREIAEDNTMWNPQDAFQRATEKLALCYGADAAGEMKTVMAEIQATIEVMDRNGCMDKGKLLALLHSYMKTRPELQALSEFLTEELEAEREAR